MMLQPMFIGTTEIILIAAVALLLFGGKKLPEMMRGLGKGMNEFKRGMNEKEDPIEGNLTEKTPPSADGTKGGDSQ